jgi:NADH:ubiquinone oxidoreductase 17.2 kD subunit
MHMKLQGHLMQMHFIEIDQVVVKKMAGYFSNTVVDLILFVHLISGRNRWVEYSEKVHLDYDASQIPAEWFGWIHYRTDLPPHKVINHFSYMRQCNNIRKWIISLRKTQNGD